MIISVPSFYPLAHQSSSLSEPQKPPLDLPLALCPPQPQATFLSHPFQSSPSPACLHQSWSSKPRSLGLGTAWLQE